MSINYICINEWLSIRNIDVMPYFTEALRGYAIPYGKSII